MRHNLLPWICFLIVQIVVFGAFRLAMLHGSQETQAKYRELVDGKSMPDIDIPRKEPLRVEPFYNRPEMVSDEELAAVLSKIRPRFGATKAKPNFLEHAIRVWSVDATFQDPAMMSGETMRDYLIDHTKFVLSWGEETTPLLEDRDDGGVGIRWGREQGGSVHHDHTLASLTEGGVTLDQPVYTPGSKDKTIRDVVLESLRDFRLDERETEWTSMAFGLWLAPVKSWKALDGREMSFDMLAERLLRGHLEKGVCSGTHRVYSMMLLVRLDQEYDILSDEVHDKVYKHLEMIRDLITKSQFEDGHWPSNWADGAAALVNPRDDELKSQVIATGHHLEWLAIAPQDLHPPKEMIEKAANWCIQTTKGRTDEQILTHFTFYSHVGNALALWRSERPSDFWRKWQETHPYVEPVDVESAEKISENEKTSEK